MTAGSEEDLCGDMGPTQSDRMDCQPRASRLHKFSSLAALHLAAESSHLHPSQEDCLSLTGEPLSSQRTLTHGEVSGAFATQIGGESIEFSNGLDIAFGSHPQKLAATLKKQGRPKLMESNFLHSHEKENLNVLKAKSRKIKFYSCIPELLIEILSCYNNY